MKMRQPQQVHVLSVLLVVKGQFVLILYSTHISLVVSARCLLFILILPLL